MRAEEELFINIKWAFIADCMHRNTKLKAHSPTANGELQKNLHANCS